MRGLLGALWAGDSFDWLEFICFTGFELLKESEEMGDFLLGEFVKEGDLVPELLFRSEEIGSDRAELAADLGMA